MSAAQKALLGALGAGSSASAEGAQTVLAAGAVLGMGSIEDVSAEIAETLD
jgi:hypothetical protein